MVPVHVVWTSIDGVDVAALKRTWGATHGLPCGGQLVLAEVDDIRTKMDADSTMVFAQGRSLRPIEVGRDAWYCGFTNVIEENTLDGRLVFVVIA